MYVCVCHGVTERQIRKAADQGACTVAALEQTLGVGAGCGTCVPMAREVLAAHLGCESKSLSEPEALPVQPVLSSEARVL